MLAKKMTIISLHILGMALTEQSMPLDTFRHQALLGLYDDMIGAGIIIDIFCTCLDYEGASYSRRQVVVALIATAVGVVFISILGVIAYFIKKNKLFHLLKTSARQSSVISIDICEDDEMCAANLERLNELFRASGQS